MRKEHREDAQRADKQHKEDIFVIREEIKTVREDMQRHENRWAALFEKFHILDKEKRLSSPRKKINTN